ncbi:MAG: hypothetical protein RLZZ74_1423 [Cyanobacteriota bacterium]|jgi:hypothetical protein
MSLACRLDESPMTAIFILTLKTGGAQFMLRLMVKHLVNI